MTVFDFDDEVERARADAISDSDKAAARTTIPQQRLPEAVRLAGWRFLDSTSVFVPGAKPRELVIGLAPWNPSELHALGALVRRSGGDTFAIQVFDIDDCQSARDIARVIPGVDPPRQTPVAAEYRDGQLIRHAEGSAAVDLLTELGG